MDAELRRVKGLEEDTHTERALARNACGISSVLHCRENLRCSQNQHNRSMHVTPTSGLHADEQRAWGLSTQRS